MQTQFDGIRTEIASLPSSTKSSSEDIELLWTEITTLQAAIEAAEAAALQSGLRQAADSRDEEFADHKAAAEQHWRTSAAALAAIEESISAMSVQPQLASVPSQLASTAEATADEAPQQNQALGQQELDELSAVLDVLDDSVAQMAGEVAKRMELTETACLSRVEWLDRRLCVIEGKPVQRVSQLTGALGNDPSSG
jgi:murein L,D-transpeptidase YcbB/YkuD